MARCQHGTLKSSVRALKKIWIRLRPSHQTIDSKEVNLLVCCQHGTLLPAWYAEKLCKSPQASDL